MRRVLVYVALAPVVAALLSAPPARAAGGSGAQGQAAAGTVTRGPAAAPAPAPGYVGSETCSTCHEDVVKKFSGNPHLHLELTHGKGAACESCHGPGQAHVDGGGDTTKIFRFGSAAPREIDARCLGCHQGAHPNFLRSDHARAGISCTSCHSVHASKTDVALLKADQPGLCYQCHADVKGTLSMPFHHPVNEGAVSCSDCHDAHGTFQKSNLKTTADQNRICTRCHAETRGPFVYEHAPVKAEGCLSCHTPHGSQNPRMLNMPSINTLCKQCHSQVAAGTFHSMNAGSTELAPCTSCHTMVHGSNLNQAFIK